MIKKAFQLVDKTYGKMDSQEAHDIYNEYFSMIYSTDIYHFSLETSYGMLKVSRFYFDHGQHLSVDKNDDAGGSILFYFMGVLTRSFNVEIHLDRYRYHLIKNVIYGYVNLEDVFVNILDFNPVNEETLRLFTFQRHEGQLVVYLEGKEVNISAFVSDYLKSLRGTENEDLLEMLEDFSMTMLKQLFRSKEDRAIKTKALDLDAMSLKKKLRLISKNKMSIETIYRNQHDHYVEILEEALSHIYMSNGEYPLREYRASFYMGHKDEGIEVNKPFRDLKLKYYSEYFIETSLLLFFDTESEIRLTENKLTHSTSKRLFRWLVGYKRLWSKRIKD